jgi:hypothetical protein
MSELLTRKRVLLAKTETVYGTDPTPTGGANAMLIKNLSANVFEAEKVNRDLIRPFLGNSENLIATRLSRCDFEVEAAGAGAAGAVPAYDCLLRACGLVPEVQEVAVTSIIVASSVATLTKTAHGYAVGDVVTVSGASDALLNGAKTILSVPNANSFTFAAAGSVDGTDGGTIVLKTSVDYTPISTGFESVTLYYNVDGVLHKITGARGTVELGLTVKQIPVFRFSFTGIYNDPADVVQPTCDFSDFQYPEIANTQNTPGFTLHGFSANLESASLNLANQIEYVTLVGSQSVKLLDRKPAGTLVFEAPTVAAKDFWSIAKNATQGAMALTHGSRAGLKVIVQASYVNLENPTYQDSNGTQMLSVPYTANPSTGDDELLIRIA